MSMQEHKTEKSLRKVGPYVIGETLGKGGFSWVKKGVDKRTQIPVALKFLEVDMHNLSSQRSQVYNEIVSLRRINNPHVVNVLSYDLKCKYPDKSGKYRKTFLVVLEYCPGGELFDILKYTHKLDTVTVRTYFIQMLEGLKACHDVGVVHRDIKPQNLLLDATFQLKITDFGLSFIAKDKKDLDDRKMKTQCGTRGFQAPELLKGARYTKSCDIFSCGVVLFILLVGYRPFEHAWREDKWYKPLCESNPEEFWNTHSTVKLEEESKELLNGMLAYRPKNRLTLQECLEHKWVAGQKVHTASELKSVLVEKYKEVRRVRVLDKKKMRQLDNSVKKPRRNIYKYPIHAGPEASFWSLYPTCYRDLSTLMVKLPRVKSFVPTFLTFFAKKTQLVEAYDVAFNVFNIAFKGKSRTTFNSQNPWEVKTTVKVSDGVYVQEFSVTLHVSEIEGTGTVAFKYQRCLGDSLAFARIWNEAEQCLTYYSESIFFDPFDEKSIPLEESKRDY